MLNPDRKIKDMDDREKSKSEIENMIENMMKTDENGYPEKDNKKVGKMTA